MLLEVISEEPMCRETLEVVSSTLRLASLATMTNMLTWVKWTPSSHYSDFQCFISMYSTWEMYLFWYATTLHSLRVILYTRPIAFFKSDAGIPFHILRECTLAPLYFLEWWRVVLFYSLIRYLCLKLRLDTLGGQCISFLLNNSWEIEGQLLTRNGWYSRPLFGISWLFFPPIGLDRATT